MKRAVAVVAVVACAAFPRLAHAEPSHQGVDDQFSFLGYVGLQMRGLGGVVPGFGTSVFFGGDGHLIIGGPQLGVLMGGRVMTDGKSRQLALGELGARYFPTTSGTGVYFAGGTFYGTQYVSSFTDSVGDLGGVFGEAGVELPRPSSGRLSMCFRADVGYAGRHSASPVDSGPFYSALTLNLGFFVGGSATKTPVRHED